jgi:ABC-type Zn2+ transport system substrate-binding protein/surface adhesin
MRRYSSHLLLHPTTTKRATTSLQQHLTRARAPNTLLFNHNTAHYFTTHITMESRVVHKLVIVGSGTLTP